MVLRLSLNLALVALALPAAGGVLAPAAAEVSRSRYLMGTVCTGAVHAGDEREGAAAIEAAFDEIARLEAILSDYRDDSELSRLNRAAHGVPFTCSADLFDFLVSAAWYGRDTRGAFDITVAPLVAAWDLRGAGRIAGRDEVAAALRAVGYDRIVLDGERRTARFSVPGMAIDPGGIGKGWALDAAARILRARGIRSASIDLGGQVIALGTPPDAASWRVDIAHPRRRDLPAITIDLADASIATSGNAERGLMADGRDLGHIVDPRSGLPVSTRGSVSVIAASAVEADALSTALMVMGPDEGLRWLRGRPRIEAIFLDVDRDGRLVARATHGLRYTQITGAVGDGALRSGGR